MTFSARVEAGVAGGAQTKSVTSLLTATTRETDVGMVEALVGTLVFQIDFLDGTVAIDDSTTTVISDVIDVLMTTMISDGCHVANDGSEGFVATTFIVVKEDFSSPDCGSHRQLRPS